jgi:hypothetical protein
VQERLRVRFLHIGVGRDVPDRVEDRIGLTTFLVTVEEEMLERISAERNHVRVAHGIEILVEQPKPLERARGTCKVDGWCSRSG